MRKREIDLAWITRQIKKTTATAVKMEFEANFNRVREDQCIECEGEGSGHCEVCDEGVIWDEATDSSSDCWECEGNYTWGCETCGGSGVANEVIHTDDDFKKAIHAKLPTRARKAILFDKVYRDGSVDTEYTVTVRPEHFKYFVDISKAFWSLGDITDHRDAIGAGFHLTILRSKNYKNTTIHFDEARSQLFAKKVEKLLPALFFVGTAGAKTRSFDYRKPRIGWERNNDSFSSRPQKYSAIYMIDNEARTGVCAIEFRLFDPCYNRPEKILEYFETVALMLEYYNNEDAKIAVKPYDFTFFTQGDPLSRLYMDKNQLKILDELLPYVLPKDVSVDEAKRQRNFTLSQEHLDKVIRRKAWKLKQEIDSYIERGYFPDDLKISKDGRSGDHVRIGG